MQKKDFSKVWFIAPVYDSVGQQLPDSDWTATTCVLLQILEPVNRVPAWLSLA